MPFSPARKSYRFRCAAPCDLLTTDLLTTTPINRNFPNGYFHAYDIGKYKGPLLLEA
jgi:hypothetical protein